ncbi:MAG TPA: nicotinamide-nucleotide amidohydrolase family protein [Candidatus Acidoferrum sp.]|nr:nicotinamide-nucleotide amidohydrolase family protein [Candidatus Acidoferrum sp.]
MSALVVTVGVALGADEHDVAALTHALREAGLDVTGRFAVDEDEVMLERALTTGAAVTVVVAGSGSSSGDVVRRTLARITGARLLLSERALDALAERYRRRDRPLPRRAERLALFPQGAALWLSPEADPAFALETEGRVIAVLPRGGDLAAIVRQHLVPFLAERTGIGEAVLTRTLRTAGVSIADVEERLTEAGARADGSEATITVLPAASGDFEVWVRITARGPGAAERLARVDRDVAEVLGEDCYGRDDDTLERVVGRLLLERGLTLSVAESCTSGLLGHRLTDIPGSSAYFERGVLVYSNQAKQDLLGVPEEILRTHGAVSAPCAEAMARGICARSGNPVGLAVTGIAGPDGGTPTKPVGTVFIGVAVSGEVEARRFQFEGDRSAVKWQSTQMALDLLRRRLMKRGT